MSISISSSTIHFVPCPKLRNKIPNRSLNYLITTITIGNNTTANKNLLFTWIGIVKERENTINFQTYSEKAAHNDHKHYQGRKGDMRLPSANVPTTQCSWLFEPS